MRGDHSHDNTCAVRHPCRGVAVHGAIGKPSLQAQPPALQVDHRSSHHRLVYTAQPLNLMIEVKGLRRPDVAGKSTAARDYWIPAVNNVGEYGRWAWAYCDDPELFRSELDRVIRNNAAKGARSHYNDVR